jgi:hypothetical protein
MTQHSMGRWGGVALIVFGVGVVVFAWGFNL